MAEPTGDTATWLKILRGKGYACRPGNPNELVHPADPELLARYDPSADRLFVSRKLKDHLIEQCQQSAPKQAEHESEEEAHWSMAAENMMARYALAVQELSVIE